MKDLRLPLAAVQALRRRLADAETRVQRLLTKVRPPAWTDAELPLADTDPFGELGTSTTTDDQGANSASRPKQRQERVAKPMNRSAQQQAPPKPAATPTGQRESQAAAPSRATHTFRSETATTSSKQQPAPQPQASADGHPDPVMKQAALRDAVSRAFAPQKLITSDTNALPAAATASAARSNALVSQSHAAAPGADPQPPASRNLIASAKPAPSTEPTEPGAGPAPITGSVTNTGRGEALTAPTGLLARLTDELFTKTEKPSTRPGPKPGTTDHRRPGMSPANSRYPRSAEPKPGFTKLSNQALRGAAGTATDGATPPQVNGGRAAHGQGLLTGPAAITGNNTLDGESLADLLNDVLVDQARRQGVDV